MAHDRLQAFGTVNKAIFAIPDASLVAAERHVTGRSRFR